MFVQRFITALSAGILTLGILLATPVTNHAATPELSWMTDIEAAKQVAAAHKKLILVHFYSPDDPFSQQMDKQVFTDSALNSFIHHAYVPVRIDVQAAPLQRQEYRIRRWPTDLVLTASGEEIFRGRSLSAASELLALLTSLRQGQATLATVEPALLHNAPPRIVPAQFQRRVSNPMPVRLEELALPTVDYGVTVSVETMTEAPAADNPAMLVASLPASEAETAGPAESTQRPSSHRHRAEFATVRWVAPRPSSTKNSSRHQARTELNPQIFKRDQQPKLSAAKPPAAGQPIVTHSRLGLDGFCPVTLRGNSQKKGNWIAGDRQYGVVHRDRLYLFAGPTQRDMFLANPDLYSPIISGYDPVILADHRQLIHGRRAYGVIFQGRIFLFSSSATMQQFWRAPRQYAAVADTAMRQAR